MIFKRKKSDVLSSTSNDGVVNEKTTSKVEILYVAAMCFVAACLSFIALEVGARSPLGHSVTKSATFNAIFRRSYNMKIKIPITNVMMGLVTTIALALGDIYGIPYLYLPWLVNTMKGMIFYEGPTLLGLCYIWLPGTGIAAGTFIILTFVLFVEELCLWFDMFSSFRHCWLIYTEQKMENAIEHYGTMRSTGTIRNKYREQILEHALGKPRLQDEIVGSVIDPKLTSVFTKSTSSDTALRLKSTKSCNDSVSKNISSEIAV